MGFVVAWISQRQWIQNPFLYFSLVFPFSTNIVYQIWIDHGIGLSFEGIEGSEYFGEIQLFGYCLPLCPFSFFLFLHFPSFGLSGRLNMHGWWPNVREYPIIQLNSIIQTDRTNKRNRQNKKIFFPQTDYFKTCANILPPIRLHVVQGLLFDVLSSGFGYCFYRNKSGTAVLSFCYWQFFAYFE